MSTPDPKQANDTATRSPQEDGGVSDIAELPTSADDDKGTSAKPRKTRKGKERWQLFPVDDHPGIYRRGDPKKGRYVVIVRAGRGRQLKRTCRTLAEAIRMQAELRLTPATAKANDKGATPFIKYAHEWVANYSGAKRGRKIKEFTRLAFEAMLKRKEFDEAFAGVKLSDVTIDHLEDYAQLLEDAKLKPMTVRNCLLPVKRCLADAHRKGHIPVNPTAGWTAGAAKSEGDRVIRALDEAELAALRAAVARTGDKTLIVLIDFLWQTGLRIGEALALDARHIDLPRRKVKVERRIREGQFDEPKSKCGKRSVPLSEEMSARLRTHLEGVQRDQPVFQGRGGGRLDYYSARRRFDAARQRATVKRVDEFGNTHEESLAWVTLHTLRHTCASLLLRRVENGGLGLNAREAQHWLGHHAVAFTMDTYATFFDDDLPSADGFDALSARIKEATPPTLHIVEPD